MTIYDKVAEFNRIAGIKVEGSNISEQTMKFRKSLILEELQELEDAVNSNDRIEQLDAIGDILYVLVGYFYVVDQILNDSFLGDKYITKGIFNKQTTLNNIESIRRELSNGIPGQFVIACFQDLCISLDFSAKTIKEAFNRIHDSNMSKFCKTEQEARQTVIKYNLDNIKTHYKLVNDLYIVYRLINNKILKSIEYTPVNLKDLV